MITKEIKEKSKAVRALYRQGLSILAISSFEGISIDKVQAILKLFYKDLPHYTGVSLGSKTEPYYKNEDEYGLTPTYSESEMESEINSILKTSKNT